MRSILSTGLIGLLPLAAATADAQPAQLQRPGISVSRAVAPVDWTKIDVDVLSAIDRAVGAWQSAAGLRGTINGPVVTFTPGIGGPPLAPAILADLQQRRIAPDVVGAIASACSAAWAAWADHYVYPPSAWYPAFAVMPAPMAPPLPNTPGPLRFGSSVAAAQLTATSLKAALRNALGPRAEESGAAAAIDRIAEAFSAAFMRFEASAVWTNQMGAGPVPTFAPPYVPVGPVVGGSITPTPGGLVGSFKASSVPSRRSAFDAKIGSHTVHLDAGTVDVSSEAATIKGAVSITVPGGVGRIALRDAVLVLEKAPAAPIVRRGATASLAKVPAPGGAIPVPYPVAPTGARGGQDLWSAARGVGTFSIEIGSTKLTYENVMLEITAGSGQDGVFIDDTGGLCSTSFGPGTSIAGSEIRLVYSRSCAGSLWTEQADLKLRSGQVSGTGTVTAFGHTFPITYAMTPDHAVSASATWSSSGRAWFPFGVNGAEMRVPSPSLSATWMIHAKTLSLSVAVRQLEVHSVAKKPNGSAWSTASISPPAATLGLDGYVVFRPPSLPRPSALPTTVNDALCDATCGELKSAGLAAAVPSGTGATINDKGTKLEYVDGWHHQCELKPAPCLPAPPCPSPRPPTGCPSAPPCPHCKNDTVCVAGWSRVDEAGVTKCSLPGAQPPAMPSIPDKIGVRLVDLM